MVLGRIAGVLLTTIAVSLLANGGTGVVVDTLDALGRWTAPSPRRVRCALPPPPVRRGRGRGA